MRPGAPLVRLALIALLAGTGLAATARAAATNADVDADVGIDPVATPPAVWRDRFHALPRIDRGNLDATTNARLDALRQRIGAALDAPVETGASDPAALIDALGELCAMYDDLGTRTSAETCYRNLRRIDPAEFRWAYQYAWMALHSGRHDDALTLLDTAATLRDDYPPLTLRRGEALYGLNRLDEARHALEAACGEPGLRARAEYFLGQIALLRRDFATAREHFETTLALDPEADAVHYPLAQALRGLGEGDAARAELAKKGHRLPKATDQYVQAVATAASGAKAHFLAGMQARDDDHPDNAVAEFAAGLALDPDNHAARISYARLLYLSGDAAGARAQLREVVNAGGPSPLAALLLGLLDEAEGDPEAAIALYRRALATEPDMAGANHHLGQALYRRGDYRAAIEPLQRAADADPNNLPARILLWSARYHGDDDAQALIRTLRAADQAQPGNPMIGYALVRLLAVAGDPAEALQRARALIDKTPIPPLRAALGAALAANGEFPAAAEALRVAADAATRAGQTAWAAQLDAERAMAERGAVPDDPWLLADPLFQARPPYPGPVFHNYPAGAAY